MFRQQQVHPDQAEIYDQPNFNSYGKRSFKGIMLMGVAIAFGVGILIWGLPKASDEEARASQQLNTYARTNGAQQVAAYQPAAGAGQKEMAMPGQQAAQKKEDEGILASIKDAFSSLLPTTSYNGASGGSSIGASGAVMAPSGQLQDAMLTMEIQGMKAEAISEAAETSGALQSATTSIYDFIGNEVQDSNKDTLGMVHDVIIDKETGEGIAILVDTNNNYYGSPLRALSYEEVVSENADKGVKISTNDDVVENRTAFDYNNMDGEKYISLISLREGLIMDYENNQVGSVEGVTYKDSQAQEIYIRLDEAMVPAGKKHLFELPFTDAQTQKGNSGYNIVLTENQTRELAEYLYQ
jgi:uncharacterized protein YrrD